MQIAIFTMGTRGDIQPYIYLAKKLNVNGCETVIGTHPCWKNLVEESHIKFAPIGPDIDIELEAAKIRGKVSNPIFSMLKTMNFVFKIIENSTAEIYNECKGKDLIIVSHSQMGATEAEALNIPTINVTLQTEMIPQTLKQKTFLDKLIDKAISGQMCKPYNRIRKVYNLPKLKSSSDLISGKINLIPISESVKKPNPYWASNNIMTGYWYDEETNYTPDDTLVKFLNAGEKPIVLALGAMAFEDKSEKEKLDMFVNAFKQTGKRAIIQGFAKTLRDYQLPDTMLAVKSIPHSYLFRQVRAVIHHCGFGTSAAAMIYGVPSIPVPFVLDQMGFAKQLVELGVSTQAINSKDLSTERIIKAINELDANYNAIYTRVKEFSAKLQSENGLQNAVNAIVDKFAKKEEK